ncbi:MAG TPA: hypothetical protein VF062_20160 [Candidatus Limnocylindrales bacterium]
MNMIRGSGPAGTAAAYVDSGRGELTVQVWLPEAALAVLAAHLERLLGRATPSTMDSLERITVCLNEFRERRRQHGWNFFTSWCHQAGVGYQRTLSKSDDQQPERIDRWCPLLHEPRLDGSSRSLGVMFFTPRSGSGSGSAAKPFRKPFGVKFREVHRRHADDSDFFSYEVDIAYTSLPASEDAFVADLTGLVRDGALGGALLPGQSRDVVAARHSEAGIPYALGGITRRIRLVDVRDTDPYTRAGTMFALELSIDANRADPAVTFLEANQRLGSSGDRIDHQHAYIVSTPLSSAARVVAHLTGDLGVTVPAGIPDRPEERLIACMEALAAGGHLSAGKPQRAMRNLVAGWFAAAGVPHTVRHNARSDTLVRSYRKPTDCIFQLRLVMDPDEGGRGITFWEEYVYLPRAGDGGNEYYYGIRTPYASLNTLTAFFETHTGSTPEGSAQPSAQLEDRLAACFAQLVARGELADGQPLRAGRDRVTAWFAQAGIPAEPVDDVWISMDE